MKCYLCGRLKAEQRIETARPATQLVDGYSLCDRHAGFIRPSDTVLRELEAERERLRRWWDNAIATHGAWNHKQQRFKDKATLTDARFPWTPDTEKSNP